MFKPNAFTRRKFLHATTAVIATGIVAGPRRVAAARVDVSSRLRVAVVGLKGRGTEHIRNLAPHLVALCDCDSSVLAERAMQFEKEHGRKVDTVVDFRRLLDRDDIDALSIATPNHTHALIGVLAAQAGKHVYCEKPVSQNIWEARQLVNAAKKYDRIVQCGTQSRSSTNVQAAAAWVRDGGLGKVRYAIGTCYKPRQSIGQLQQPLTIPASIDYDLWCGPVTKVDLYRPHLHYDWHWDFHTGNGDMGNQGIHQVDMARWFLGHKTMPPRVISIGGRLGYDDAGNTPNTQVVLYDYPEAPILFETRGLPKSKQHQANWLRSMDRYRGSQIGVVVQCEEGYVLIDGSNDAVTTAFDHTGKVVKRFEVGEKAAVVRHFENFIEAIHKGNQSVLNAPIVEGHISSALCHAGNISHRLGNARPAKDVEKYVRANELLANSVDRMLSHLRLNGVDVDSQTLVVGKTLEMDPATERFTNSDSGNQLLRRNDRPSFAIPLI